MAIRFHRTALVAGDKQQEAAAFAAEVSQYVTESMGMTTTWGIQVGGPLSTVHWFTDFENMAEMEAGLVKTITDDGYLKLLAKTGHLFVEGRSEDSIIYMM